MLLGLPTSSWTFRRFIVGFFVYIFYKTDKQEGEVQMETQSPA